MRSFIIGTAGHIDHGKSTLVKALTGTDPDRLKEEKERGITIDLGFAHAPLSDGIMASYIDVPGHEKFVRNMLAGAPGIDAVLFVVAATEGVMPQTREHFHICRLLGIERGVVALTKIDVADPAATVQAESGIRDLVRDSFLDGAAIVRVDARKGSGLDHLRDELLRLANATATRARSGPLRLPIDRVFTLKGFGTVVTGTLMSGEIAAGDEIVALPHDGRGRVRGLQVHGASVSAAAAGERTAVNLAGLLVGDLSRGDVLARAGTLVATRAAIVELRLIEGAVLKHGARVHVHAASAEVLARVRLAAGKAGSSGTSVAELRFESPVVLARGDRIILRSYSPIETVGGARILDPSPEARTLKELARLDGAAQETDALALARFIAEAGVRGLGVSSIGARLGLTAEASRKLLAGVSSSVLLNQGEHVVDRDVHSKLEAASLDRLRQMHEADRLAIGASREELRRRVSGRAAPFVFDAAISNLVSRGLVVEHGDRVALKTHEVRLSSPEDETRRAVEEALAAAGLEGLPLQSLHTQLGHDQKTCENAVRVIVQQKNAERIGNGLLIGRAALDDFRSRAKARFKAGSALDVAEVKELTGLSRKYVIPLLEWLDRERVTRRVGASRIVL